MKGWRGSDRQWLKWVFLEIFTREVKGIIVFLRSTKLEQDRELRDDYQQHEIVVTNKSTSSKRPGSKASDMNYKWLGIY